MLHFYIIHWQDTRINWNAEKESLKQPTKYGIVPWDLQVPFAKDEALHSKRPHQVDRTF